MSGPRLRDAVRGVILDPDDRILLVRFEFPNWTGWATPGGGVDPGESHEDAIRRELAEETGLELSDLGPVIWTRTHLFDLGLDSWDGQIERYFLVRTDAFEPRPQLSWAELNAEYVTAIRWWTPGELDAPGTALTPRRLPSLVRALLEDGPPTTPIGVGE